MRKFIVALAMAVMGVLGVSAQQMFKPTMATIVDEAGSHDFFSSFDVAPIEVTDLSTSVNLLMGESPVELKQEPDNQLEYSNKVHGKKHRDVVTKAYRDAATGKIMRITVTTYNPRDGVRALVITFTPSVPEEL